MADIRIKDLTTTASSTASGDFFVIDGTTGTRKVNAFNPSFGGSATLTGTLTVNGTGNSSFAGQLIQVADPATISLWKDSTPTKAARFQFNTLADNGFSLGVYDGSSWVNAITVAPTTGVVKIPSSSASSSTITGALVVSGGVGIGGSLNAGANNAANSITGGDSGSGTYILQLKDGGGNLKVNFKGNGDVNLQSSTASTTTSSGALVVAGGVGVAGAINSGGAITAGVGTHSFGTSAGGGVNSFGSLLTYFNIRSTSDSDNPIFRIYDGRVNVSAFEVNARTQVVTLPGTTASTSTSSGALVVSGGVGVAGAINCGGDITAPTTANITGGRFTSVNSNSYIEQSGSDFNYVTASTRPHVFSIGGTTRFQVTTSGIISSLPASAASLTANSTMTFELTSNTSLKIFVRGSDGTTRSTTLTLA